MLAFRSILIPGPERWTLPALPVGAKPIEVEFQAVLFAIRVSPSLGGRGGARTECPDIHFKPNSFNTGSGSDECHFNYASIHYPILLLQ